MVGIRLKLLTRYRGPGKYRTLYEANGGIFPLTPFHDPILSFAALVWWDNVLKMIQKVLKTDDTSDEDKCSIIVDIPLSPKPPVVWYQRPAVQWRSKALMGHGSTVTWGPSLSLPSTSPPSLSPPPFPPLPQPLTLPRTGPQIQLGGLGERCKQPQPKSNLVHFSLKIRHLVATVLMLFLRVLPKIFLWPTTRGPRSSGVPIHWTAWTPGSYATAAVNPREAVNRRAWNIYLCGKKMSTIQ